MAVTFPSDSDYDKDTWNLLAGFWHPVARVEDVRPKELTSAHLLGVPLVLYHTSIGLAVATDICPHRGARLSKGWMKGDSLVCPYHGLEFDSSGQCERVPASEPHRDNCDSIRLETLSWAEKYGIIWVCLSGEPAIDLPNWAQLSDDTYQVAPMDSAVWDASPGRHAENFNDVAHLSFIHAGTFGNPNDTLIERYQVEKTDTGLNRTFTYNQLDRDTFEDKSGKVTPMSYGYKYTYPFSSELCIRNPDAQNLVIFDCICPIDPTTSKIFITLARDYDHDQPVADLLEFQTAVNAEDKGVVESQLPKLVPLHPRREKHIAADAWSMEFRSGFVRLGLSRTTGI